MRFWLSVLLLALVFVSSARAATKPEVEFLRCPDTYEGGTFSGFDIFQGPPDAKEYLVADDDGWNLQDNRVEGQKFYLACHYGEGHPDAQFEIPPNIDFCTPAGFNVDCR